MSSEQCTAINGNYVRCEMFSGHPSYHAAKRGERWVEWRDGDLSSRSVPVAASRP